MTTTVIVRENFQKYRFNLAGSHSFALREECLGKNIQPKPNLQPSIFAKLAVQQLIQKKIWGSW
jgi:hypothetical protein